MATDTETAERRATREAGTRTTRTMGTLHEFRPDREELSTYLERVEIFFAANDVPDEKKVPVLLNAIGGVCTECCVACWPPTTP